MRHGLRNGLRHGLRHGLRNGLRNGPRNGLRNGRNQKGLSIFLIFKYVNMQNCTYSKNSVKSCQRFLYV